MFYNRFVIFNDGEFVASYDDRKEAETFWEQLMIDRLDADANLEDHEFQMFELIRGRL